MAKPDYYHELKTSGSLLRRDLDELVKTVVESRSEAKKTLDCFVQIDKEFAVMEEQLVEQMKRIQQQQGEQSKRIEEWDRRFWGLLVAFVGAALSLAAGLIVSLARR